MQRKTDMVYAAGRTKEEALERLSLLVQQWKEEYPLYHYLSHEKPVITYDRQMKLYSCKTVVSFEA